MRRSALGVATAGIVLACSTAAHAEANTKRKVAVIEYRSGSAALPGIAKRIAAALGKQTSLTVLGPDATREVYGDKLDQNIVRCQGEAECVARIGSRAGVAEVILVGVSELGDVIVTMQRIDVSARTVSTRIADSIANGVAPTDAQLTDYLTRLLPPSDFVRFGVIDIIASEAGANVTVGGKPRGTTPIQALTVHAPASYEIRVTKPGFVTFNAQIAVPPDGEVKVRANMQHRTAPPAWYDHWYVLTVAGIVVAGAAGSAIYFAERNNGSGTPSTVVPVTGTIN